MIRILAMLLAGAIVVTGLALLIWLVTSDLWAPLPPLPGLGFAGLAILAWLGLAIRLEGRAGLRRHGISAASLLALALLLEISVWWQAGAYSSIGVTLALLGGSGGLVFTVARHLLEEGEA